MLSNININYIVSITYEEYIIISSYYYIIYNLEAELIAALKDNFKPELIRIKYKAIDYLLERNKNNPELKI